MITNSVSFENLQDPKYCSFCLQPLDGNITKTANSIKNWHDHCFKKSESAKANLHEKKITERSPDKNVSAARTLNLDENSPTGKPPTCMTLMNRCLSFMAVVNIVKPVTMSYSPPTD